MSQQTKILGILVRSRTGESLCEGRMDYSDAGSSHNPAIAARKPRGNSVDDTEARNAFLKQYPKSGKEESRWWIG